MLARTAVMQWKIALNIRNINLTKLTSGVQHRSRNAAILDGKHTSVVIRVSYSNPWKQRFARQYQAM